MTITRDGKQVYEGEVPVSQMKRSLTELAGWLYRETDFVNGCFPDDGHLSCASQ